MYKFLLLFGMIFLHIVDDYYMQGILSQMKQREWWVNNAPSRMYKRDYLMAMFMHGFSWSFMIMIVPTIYVLVAAYNVSAMIFAIILFFIANLGIHMFVDDMKANKKKINLIQDQLTHLAQILITWIVLVVLV